MSVITYIEPWEKNDICNLLNAIPYNSHVIGLDLSLHPIKFDVDISNITTSLMGWRTTKSTTLYSSIKSNLNCDTIDSICECIMSEDQKRIDLDRIRISYPTTSVIINVKLRTIEESGAHILDYNKCKIACPNIIGFTSDNK